MATHNTKGFATSALIAVLMTVAFISALGFGIWAFIGMQENQTNLSEKIEAASDKAVEQAEAAKEIEFAEREKSPFKRYTGPAIYGSLAFDYPKSWSIYAAENASGTLVDLYAQPNIIPGLDKEVSFALRVQILSTSYDTEVKKFDSDIKAGKVQTAAYKLSKVATQTGLMVTGEIVSDKQGTMVLLPQRDKTIKIWSESVDFANDYAKIIDSVTFIP